MNNNSLEYREPGHEGSLRAPCFPSSENKTVGQNVGNLRHGHCAPGKNPSRTYVSWSRMKQRCQYAKHHIFHDYGGRGIRVCERWQEFKNFLADMGERPDGKTLDRKDVDGNYEPGNCRWATRLEQERNKRGRSSVAERRLPKPHTGVRFASPAILEEVAS